MKKESIEMKEIKKIKDFIKGALTNIFLVLLAVLLFVSGDHFQKSYNEITKACSSCLITEEACLTLCGTNPGNFETLANIIATASGCAVIVIAGIHGLFILRELD